MLFALLLNYLYYFLDVAGNDHIYVAFKFVNVAAVGDYFYYRYRHAHRAAGGNNGVSFHFHDAVVGAVVGDEGGIRVAGDGVVNLGGVDAGRVLGGNIHHGQVEVAVIKYVGYNQLTGCKTTARAAAGAYVYYATASF